MKEKLSVKFYSIFLNEIHQFHMKMVEPETYGVLIMVNKWSKLHLKRYFSYHWFFYIMNTEQRFYTYNDFNVEKMMKILNLKLKTVYVYQKNKNVLLAPLTVKKFWEHFRIKICKRQIRI